MEKMEEKGGNWRTGNGAEKASRQKQMKSEKRLCPLELLARRRCIHQWRCIRSRHWPMRRQKIKNRNHVIRFIT